MDDESEGERGEGVSRSSDVRRDIENAFVQWIAWLRYALICGHGEAAEDHLKEARDSRARVLASLAEDEAERDELKAENERLRAKVNRMVATASIEDIQGVR